MSGFYISGRGGDLGPRCGAYGSAWAGGAQDPRMAREVFVELE